MATHHSTPILLWGPYLWTDGVKGRKIDDLIWKREDTRNDGTHPSDTGAEKVAQHLAAFFKTGPSAKIWYSVTLP